MLSTDGETLSSLGLDPQVTRQITLSRALLRHVLRTPLLERPLLGNLQAVIDYLANEIGHCPVETLRVLYLDSGNRLIDELVQTGEVDHVPLSVRAILHRGLIVGAAGIILAHNHPSGDNAPSRADREITRTLARVGSGLGISLIDHLIIAGSQVRSLKAEAIF
ncbi:hypothetical protein K9B35_19415 [Sphingomonas sp. R647]|uniref:JAB domain-containing protein n=1 Tax=Sphingomonas sp. R647 TaxID=2875233 RepID=UPI001CD5AFCA|nr:JAB domain-containing protein [Sphingomonas sp. R647]MCA1200142.1 hypothetical protein [Sphingomonas sp. R647]